MTIHKRLPGGPGAEKKKLAAIERQMEQNNAARRLRSSTLVVRTSESAPTVRPGETALFTKSDGMLYTSEADGAERQVGRTSPAPFPNAEFEDVDATGFPLTWTRVPLTFGQGDPPVEITSDITDPLTGTRSLRAEFPTENAGVKLYSEPFTMAAGSTVTATGYARGVGDAELWFSLISAVTEDPLTIASPVHTDTGQIHDPGAQWAPYATSLTPPDDHTRARLEITLMDTSNATGSIDLSGVNVNVDLVSEVRHDEYLRRAASALMGGGIRTIVSGGAGYDIKWSQPFRVVGAGRQADEAMSGYFDIAVPPNGTVIPVHGSASRSSYTVASGAVRLMISEALWYELPLSAGASSDPGRFHIVGNASDYTIGPGWVMVCAYGNTTDVENFKWGDGRSETPWKSVVNYTNSWVSTVGAVNEYRRVNGMVEGYFDIKSGALNTAAFTVDSGFRPRSSEPLYPGFDGVPNFQPFQVFTNGQVVPYGTSNTRWRGHFTYTAAG